MNSIPAFFSRHERIALQISAGKDSAACLQLLEPWWDRLVVVWGNQGNPYPETVEYMQAVRRRVPYFQEIRGKQPDWVRLHGYPVDALPFASSFVGVASGSSHPLYSLSAACCASNLWEPLARFIRDECITGVIRGQRFSDTFRAGQSGDLQDGVEYFFPLETWSDREVLDFLGPNLPASYTRGVHSSLDCLDCTAWVAENRGKLADLEVINPAAFAKVSEVRVNLSKQLETLLAALKD